MASEQAIAARRSFFPPTDYPELEPLHRSWSIIRAEGATLRPDMMWIEDVRAIDRRWAFAPLRLEEEDRTDELDALGASMRARAPSTTALADQIPRVLGYGFSLLLAHGHIGAHAHENPYVTAMLCLTAGTPCWIRVGAETKPIRVGELLIFDYTLEHEIRNESDVDRLALLVLLPNKSREVEP